MMLLPSHHKVLASSPTHVDTLTHWSCPRLLCLPGDWRQNFEVSVLWWKVAVLQWQLAIWLVRHIPLDPNFLFLANLFGTCYLYIKLFSFPFYPLDGCGDTHTFVAGRWKQEDQELVQGHSQLHMEFENTLAVWDPVPQIKPK